MKFYTNNKTLLQQVCFNGILTSQLVHIPFTWFLIVIWAQSCWGNYDSFPFHADYALNLSKINLVSMKVFQDQTRINFYISSFLPIILSSINSSIPPSLTLRLSLSLPLLLSSFLTSIQFTWSSTLMLWVFKPPCT